MLKNIYNIKYKLYMKSCILPIKNLKLTSIHSPFLFKDCVK